MFIPCYRHAVGDSLQLPRSTPFVFVVVIVLAHSKQPLVCQLLRHTTLSGTIAQVGSQTAQKSSHLARQLSAYEPLTALRCIAAPIRARDGTSPLHPTFHVGRNPENNYSNYSLHELQPPCARATDSNFTLHALEYFKFNSYN